jgi:hypothetical protein
MSEVWPENDFGTTRFQNPGGEFHTALRKMFLEFVPRHVVRYPATDRLARVSGNDVRGAAVMTLLFGNS